jgi:MYXO-CTERM domain-containing protein
MGAVDLVRLDVMDGWGLEEAGFDFAAVEDMLEDVVMPKMAAQFGQMPLTGPIFGFGGYYVILRELRTTDGWLLVKADLFRAPEDDWNAPETYVDEQPNRPVRPADAALLVSGADPEVPAELLQFAWSVDGAAQGQTYIRKLTIGEEGRTAVYHVEVAAVDLNGNVDPTPVWADVTVDGVLPQLSLLDRLSGQLDTATPSIAWVASDDLSPADALSTVVEVNRILPSRAAEKVSEETIDPGRTDHTLSLEPGTEYRVVVRVRDEAGNTASASMLFTVSPDADDPTPGCGCRAGGQDDGTPAGAAAGLLFAAALLLRRRFAR